MIRSDQLVRQANRVYQDEGKKKQPPWIGYFEFYYSKKNSLTLQIQKKKIQKMANM